MGALLPPPPPPPPLVVVDLSPIFLISAVQALRAEPTLV